MKEDWIYKRGDLYYANLNPYFGSEQGGTRPVLVLQNNVGNFFCPTLIVAPLTSKWIKKKVYSTASESAVISAFPKRALMTGWITQMNDLSRMPISKSTSLTFFLLSLTMRP